MIRMQVLLGLTGLIAAMSLPLLPRAMAQLNQTSLSTFQGRGVAQGAAFTQGRNANVSLTIDRDNFGLELAEPPGTRARVQYRGSIIRRQSGGSTNPNSFTLDGRVRTFSSSDNLRVLNNTTGTCRVEVFDARVNSISCNSVAQDGPVRFLGLEQF
jgi:hypothetical protein